MLSKHINTREKAEVLITVKGRGWGRKHHKILFRLRAFLELRWGLGEGRAPQSYSPCVVLREEMAKRFGSWFPSEKKKKKIVGRPPNCS